MKYFDKIEEVIILITFPLMLITVLASTFTRFFNVFSIPWGEELARYLMIWLGFAGVGYGFKKNAHLGLSFLVDRLPPTIQHAMIFLRSLIIMLFGGLIAWFSYQIILKQFAFHQVSPSLHVPMWTVYLAVFMGGVLTIVRVAQWTFSGNKATDDGELRTEGQ